MTSTTGHHPTSSINHHRTIRAVAAAGLVGTLLAVTAGSASAMPGRGDPPAAPAPAAAHADHGHGHNLAHGCFITPQNLNDAEAQELPVCYTYVP